MAIRNIRRQATNPLAAPGTPTTAPIYVDSDDNILKMIPAGSGTTEVQIIDASSAQTLQNKVLATPAIAAGVTTGPVLVAGGSTLTMTENSHAGKTIALDTATGSVITLPASTGGGTVYKFLVTVTATSNSHIIKVGTPSDEMRGYVIQDADTATAPNTWWAADNDDTITLNRTTTGLAAQGEYFEIVDAVLNHFYVRGYSQASGTEATPFSATV